MNDPNGMFRDDNGTYQYNPTGLVAGNQHWGTPLRGTYTTG